MNYFWQCSSLETNPCVLILLFPWLSKKLSQLPNLELDSLLSRFYGSVRTKNIYEWGVQNKYWLLFFRGMVEIIVPSVKLNLGLLFTSGQ